MEYFQRQSFSEQRTPLGVVMRMPATNGKHRFLGQDKTDRFENKQALGGAKWVLGEADTASLQPNILKRTSAFARTSTLVCAKTAECYPDLAFGISSWFVHGGKVLVSVILWREQNVPLHCRAASVPHGALQWASRTCLDSRFNLKCGIHGGFESRQCQTFCHVTVGQPCCVVL